MRHRITLAVFTLGCVAGAPLQVHSQEPTPHSIIERALTAGGGAEKISEFKAISFKTHAKIGDAKVTLTGLFAGPTLFRMELETKDGATLCVGGGDTFWTKPGKEPLVELSRASDASKFDLSFGVFYALGLPDQLLSLKRGGYKLTVVGDQAVNGVNAVAMRVNHELYPEAMLYFEKETGLPVKSQLKLPPSKDGLARLFAKPGAETETMEVFFDDYKEFDGVKHFTKVGVRLGGEPTMEFELRDIKLLKKVDSGNFKKPMQPDP